MVHIETGSEELKSKMPYGVMVKMADVFGVSSNWISRVVSGEVTSKKPIVECAIEIAKLEDEKQIELNEILDDYRHFN